MALQSSGAISLNDIATEFGGSTPHSLSEYYRDGGLVTSNNTSVPTSGTISIGNFYGAADLITETASNNQTNIVLSSVFGSNWAANTAKRYHVPSGVNLGGTNTHAVHANSGMGGTLEILVNGTITGYGGDGAGTHTNGGTVTQSGFSYIANNNAGNGYDGGDGGNAIKIDVSNVTVTNLSLIHI